MKLNMQKKQDLRVNSIVKNALKLFALKGFDQTSIDDICHAAKISHGLIYHYFENKEQIFDTIIKKAKDYFAVSFNKSKNQYHGDAKGALYTLCDVFLEAMKHDDDPLYYAHLFLTMHARKQQDAISEKYISKKSAIDIIRAVFKELQNEGYLDKNQSVDVAILCFITLVRGLSFTVVKSKNRDEIRKTLPTTEYIMNLFIKEQCK